MSTPTPRTDAAWASSFEPCEYRAAHTARTMRDECAKLERELTTLRPELEKVYALVTPVGFDLPGGIFETAQAVTELRAERDQLRAELADQAARFHDEIVSRQGTVRANQELDLKELNHFRAELAAEREKVTMLLSDAYALTKNWHDRAERAEAELAKYLSACPASPTEEERKRCQQWWAVSGKSP